MLHLLICLFAVLIAGEAFADDWQPEPEDARALCERLTDPLQRSILLDRHGLFRQQGYEQRNASQTVKADIDNDGILDTVTRTRAHLGWPRMETDIERWMWPMLAVDRFGSRDEDLHRALNFGAGSVNLLPVSEHTYLLASYDHAETDPTVLAIVGPDLRAKPLCWFAPNISLAVTGFQWPVYWPYCLAIADREHLPALEVRPVAEDDPVREAFEGRDPGWPDVVGELVVDIFNTGEPVRLLKLRYSGKGRDACPVEKFVTVPDPSVPEEQARQRSARLMQAQRAMQPPREDCPNEVVVFDPGRVDLLKWQGQVLVHAITPRPHAVEFVNKLHRRENGDIGEQGVCWLTRVKGSTIRELNLDWLAQ